MRKHTGIVMSYWLALALILVCLAGFSPVILLPSQVFATGGDDFNDNSKDPMKWGADIIPNGKCAMNEVNRRLEFTCRSASIDWNEVIHPWILTELPYDTNWDMQIDITNETNLTANDQWTNFGIGVISQYTEDNGIYAGLYASTYGGLPAERGFWSEMDTVIDYYSAWTGDLGVKYGAIRLTFDSGTKVISAWYDIDPNTGYDWVEFASYGISGSGGSNGTANWGLVNGDKLWPFIYGYSEYIKISSGQLYGDNFQETGGVAPPPPESSLYDGTIGTQITIMGTGFGEKKGKVLLGTAALKIAKDGWSDTSITGTISKVPLPAGSYPASFEIVVQTKDKPPKYLSPTNTFTVQNPFISSYTTLSRKPGAEVTVEGNYFGGKKGKVYLVSQADPTAKPKSCKVTYWYMSPTDGMNSQLKFIVPKVGPGSYWLYVSNKVGNSPKNVPFDVE